MYVILIIKTIIITFIKIIMKDIIGKFALSLIFLFTVALVSCRKEEEARPLSVQVYAQQIELPYEMTAKIEFFFMNAEDELSVTVQNIPEGVSYEIRKTGKRTGEIVFSSLRDENVTSEVRLVFRDKRTSVTKSLIINLLQDRTPFSVNVKARSVSIVAYRIEKILYDAKNQDGPVSVRFRESEDEIRLENEFDTETSKGTLSFTTSIKEEMTLERTLVFSDGRKDCEVKIKFETGKWAVIPEDPIISVTSDIIYPKECGRSVVMPFTVSCGSDIDDVKVMTSEGIEAVLEVAPDRKSGKITVMARENLKSREEVCLSAENSAGRAEAKVILQKAYLRLEMVQIESDCKADDKNQPVVTISDGEVTIMENPHWEKVQTTIEVKDMEGLIEWVQIESNHRSLKGSLKVVTNLEFDARVVTTDNANITKKDNDRVTFMVNDNPLWESRKTVIEVKDREGLIRRELKIVQAKTIGSNATDRAALMAIYDSLNMKEWIDYGSFGTYYRNWGTDVPMGKWLGTDWTDIDGYGRCNGLVLTAKQPKSTGVISEEIGKLTELKELIIFPKHRFTKMPDNIKDLIKLESICFAGDIMDMDISEWKGINDLMNNPENKIKNLNFSKTGLHGKIPEWNIPKNCFSISGCHFSGQVPDAVAKSAMWSEEKIVEPDFVEKSPIFDKSKYRTKDTGVGDGSFWYIMTEGEEIIYSQADNYALWVGERPSNTKWVNDKFGGHWEWTE